MKSNAEQEMDRTQSEVRRLIKELDAAILAADLAWTLYVEEGRTKLIITPNDNAEK